MTATFTPDQPLLQNHTYVGHIKTIVKDLLGNRLQNEFIWTFSTGLVLSPMVLKTSPENNEVDVDIQKTIEASFSMPMSPGLIDSSFTLMQGMNKVVGVFSYYDTSAFFIPTNPLLPGTPEERFYNRTVIIDIITENK